MLSMSNVANAGAAKSYYGGQKAGDYYAKEGGGPDAGGPDGSMAKGQDSHGDGGIDGSPAGSASGASAVGRGAGWRLNLNVIDEVAARISAFLAARGVESELRNPDDPDGGGLTVHGGDRDAAADLGALLHREFGREILPPSEASLTDDLAFAGNVRGRFEVSQGDSDFHRYGFAGVPFLKHDMASPGFLPDRVHAIDDARERAAGILTTRYGGVFSGTGREPDPARVDRVLDHGELPNQSQRTDSQDASPSGAAPGAQPAPSAGLTAPHASGRAFGGADLRASEWFGKGAEAAGLSGPVTLDSFQSVLEGQVPNGPKLGRQQRGKEGSVGTVHASGRR